MWQERFSGIRKLSSLLVKDTMSELLLSTKRYQEANRRPRVCLTIHTKDKSYRNLSLSLCSECICHSYSYNVKLFGVPEIKPRENASETSQLCLNTFNAIATCTGTHRYDID